MESSSEYDALIQTQGTPTDDDDRGSIHIRKESTVARQLKGGLEAWRKLAVRQRLVVAACVSAVVAGNIGVLLSLNMWVHTLSKAKSVNPFSILMLLSATVCCLYYSVALSVWCMLKRQSIRFVFNKVSFGLLAADALSSVLATVCLVFATGMTPEVLQAISISTQVVWAFLFVKIIFAEKRSYCSPLVVMSFFLCLGGVTLGMAGQFTNDQSFTTDRIYWSIIFTCAQIPCALHNVISAKFLRRYTKPSSANEPKCEEVLASSSPQSPKSQLQVHDPTTVKLAMLCFSGFFQLTWQSLLLPIDALPWFGSNPNDLGGVGESLKRGFACTLAGSYPHCEHAIWFYLAFTFSCFLEVFGTATLNHYNPALTSLVVQLCSPLGAIVLIAFPLLNPHHVKYNIGESIGAAVLLIAATLLYSAWEESTRQEEVQRREIVVD